MNKNIDIYLYGYSGNARSLQEFASLFSTASDFVVMDLPGFSDGQQLEKESHRNILVYANHMIRQIEATAQNYTSVRLIGHSHGAMLAFAVASLRPELAKEIVLLCPVASPRTEVKIFMYAMKAARHTFGTRATLWIVKRRLMVDLVTKRVSNSTWSKTDYQRIKEIRRSEVSYYNRTLLDCADQVKNFKDLFNDSFLKTKAVVLYTTDDTVAGKNDYMWFQRHIPESTMLFSDGGHHVVVAHPQKTVTLLKKGSE